MLSSATLSQQCCHTASVDDADAIKNILANASSSFLIKGKLDFSNAPKNLAKNHPYFSILCN